MSDAAVLDLLTRLGGVSTRSRLVGGTCRADVEHAVAGGEVVALARGRYALASVDEAVAAAHRLDGVLSRRSAALQHGWAVKEVPVRPDVTVPRKRRPQSGATATVHFADLGPDDRSGGVTSADRTLLDCARNLPFDEALCVADSALRSGYRPERLAALTRDARGAGAGRMRRVAAAATPLADNPFESVLRAIALEVAGLDVRPQVAIRDPHFLGRPDLVDADLRVALEADSFTWHGGRAQLARDARRYNALVVAGWLVLRFSWEDVMREPALVRATIEAAVHRQAQVCFRGACAA